MKTKLKYHYYYIAHFHIIVREELGEEQSYKTLVIGTSLQFTIKSLQPADLKLAMAQKEGFITNDLTVWKWTKRDLERSEGLDLSRIRPDFLHTLKTASWAGIIQNPT